MKYTRSVLTIKATRSLALFVIALSPAVQYASAATIKFDSFVSPANNDLVNYFTLNGTPQYAQVTTGGVTGGAVDPAGNNFGTQSAIYNTPASPGMGSGIDTSLFFKFQSLGPFAGPTVRLGWVGSTSTPITFNPSTYFWVEPYNNSRFAILANDGASFSVPLDVPVAPMIVGHWYRVALDVDSLGGIQFSAAVSLQDFGTSGNSAGTVLYSGGVNLTNATAAADPTWHAGFFAGPSTGADLVDNFSTS